MPPDYLFLTPLLLQNAQNHLAPIDSRELTPGGLRSLAECKQLSPIVFCPPCQKDRDMASIFSTAPLVSRPSP